VKPYSVGSVIYDEFILLKIDQAFIILLKYHGGTNFDRTAGGPFITTSYDYDAPIDEYGWALVILDPSVNLCLEPS
jgi:hypothetical protein